MEMKHLIVAGCLCLGACHQDPPAVPSDRVVVEQVPVAVQPITKEQIPVLPGQLPPHPADPRDGEKVALAARCDAIAFVIKAWPLLQVAAGLPAVPAPDYPECRKH